MSKGYGKAIGTNIDFSGKCTVPKETTAEIKAYVKEKMLIVDDFLVGRKKLNAEQKKALRETMLAMETTSSIDSYFRDFITARI
jgi:ABC-type phosphate/phosphonate transport system substrate-binding protein